MRVYFRAKRPNELRFQTLPMNVLVLIALPFIALLIGVWAGAVMAFDDIGTEMRIICANFFETNKQRARAVLDGLGA